MTKIVSAANAMITNHKKITDVEMGGDPNEVFFIYNGKYKWSIRKAGPDDVWLYYYPGNESLQKLMTIDGEEWEGVPMVVYTLKEIGTKEARDTFNELFTLVKEKVHGVDEVLDDIIDDLPF